jgi:hypothetical protein
MAPTTSPVLRVAAAEVLQVLLDLLGDYAMPSASRRAFDPPSKRQRAAPSLCKPVSAQIASIVIAQIR